MKKVRTMYLKLICCSKDYKGDPASKRSCLIVLGGGIKLLKEVRTAMFGRQCGPDLHVLNFHLHEHVVDILEWFVNLETLHPSSFERFDMHLNGPKQGQFRSWPLG